MTKAKFPTEQRLALTSDLVLGVENTGDEPLPELAFTIETDDGDADGSFQVQIDDPSASNPNRPVWILENKYPRATDDPIPKGISGGLRAQTNTFGFGPLDPGEEKTIVWRLTAVEAGTYTLHYRVEAGLDGRSEGRHRRRRRGEGRVRCHDQRQGAEGDGQRQGAGRHRG